MPPNWRICYLLRPTGQYFVHITLVRDVKKYLVTRGLKNPVQRYAQFDHSEVRREVSSRVRQGMDEQVPHLLSKLGQALRREGFQICRRMNAGEEGSLLPVTGD